MIYFCQFNVRIMYGKITSTLPVNKLYVPALVAEITQWVEIISEVVSTFSIYLVSSALFYDMKKTRE